MSFWSSSDIIILEAPTFLIKFQYKSFLQENIETILIGSKPDDWLRLNVGVDYDLVGIVTKIFFIGPFVLFIIFNYFCIFLQNVISPLGTLDMEISQKSHIFSLHKRQN